MADFFKAKLESFKELQNSASNSELARKSGVSVDLIRKIRNGGRITESKARAVLTGLKTYDHVSDDLKLEDVFNLD
ncbi:MAG: hypothetical protein HWE20_03930 [Gammaproteobacteria bacterium]|nr:hypothetical protein [Gammaproteobacteria bacterium]